MRPKHLYLFAILGLATFAAAAEGVTGRWKGDVQSPNGPVAQVFEFSTDGDKLNGTFSNRFVSPKAIENGTIKGNELSFSVRLSSMILGYKGILNGDEITLTTSALEGRPPGGPEETTFKLTRSTE